MQLHGDKQWQAIIYTMKYTRNSEQVYLCIFHFFVFFRQMSPDIVFKDELLWCHSRFLGHYFFMIFCVFLVFFYSLCHALLNTVENVQVSFTGMAISAKPFL